MGCPPWWLQAYGLDDTIGCLLDCEGGSIAFTKSGKPLGPAFQLPQVGGPEPRCMQARKHPAMLQLCLRPRRACTALIT